MKNYKIFSLFGISLLLRFLLFFFSYNHVTIYPDSEDYIILYDYLKDLSLKGYNGWRSPGYPLLFFLTNGNTLVLVYLQLFLGSITSVIWYKTLNNINFNNNQSFYIALFLSVLLNVIFYETCILSESITLFLLTIIIYLLSQGYFKNQDITKDILLSFTIGFLVLVKPFFAYLPFLIFGFYILDTLNVKKIISYKLLIFVFPLLAYFGWSYVNKINTGYYVSTTFFGLNISQNCVRFAEKGPEEYQWIIKPYVDYREKSLDEKRNIAFSIWYAYHEGSFDKYNLSFPDLSNELGKFAKKTIKNNPDEYLKQVIFHSWLDFWKPGIFWKYSKIKRGKLILDTIWQIQKLVLLAVRGVFLLLVFYYLYNYIKNKENVLITMLVSIVFIASLLQAFITYGSNSRYSFPFEFIMVICVAFFFSAFLKKLPKYHMLIKESNLPNE